MISSSELNVNFNAYEERRRKNNRELRAFQSLTSPTCKKQKTEYLKAKNRAWYRKNREKILERKRINRLRFRLKRV